MKAGVKDKKRRGYEKWEERNSKKEIEGKSNRAIEGIVRDR